VGTVLSAALLLRHSLGLEDEAAQVEAAVEKTLADGVRGKDIGGTSNTQEIEAALLAALG
jgi:3-isopropylmalate dehydrogenase